MGHRKSFGQSINTVCAVVRDSYRAVVLGGSAVQLIPQNLALSSMGKEKQRPMALDQTPESVFKLGQTRAMAEKEKGRTLHEDT